MSEVQPHILIGNSVRYLAQSAANAGLPVIALDAFGDLDTRLAAEQVQQAVTPTPQALLDCLNRLACNHDQPWVYGAGFETAPDTLAELIRCQRNVQGNSSEVLRILADPRRYFALLQELDIVHPDSQLSVPEMSKEWLFKAAGRNGGMQVWPSSEVDQTIDGYYQRFVDGELCSILFAADGQDLQTLGFNQLAAINPQQGNYRFSHVINGYQPDLIVAEQMKQAAQRLTRALGLRGTNGLDFVLTDGKALLLDVNARPPACLELYEQALPKGGLRTHLEACNGRLPKPLEQSSVQGMQLLYAQHDCHIGQIAWPHWISDRPVTDSHIQAGMPLCSVHASGATTEQVAGQLQQHAHSAQALINNYSEVAA